MINEKEIAIICCSPEENDYKHTNHELEKLTVPEGFKLNIININGNFSRAAMFNEACRVSNAKYKIYINSPIAQILNTDFLRDILAAFQVDDKIAMLGLLGTPQLSTTGEIFNSPVLYGKLSFYNGKIVEGQPFSDIITVSLIHSSFFATQYDIPFREDVFFNDAYVAESQCVEFKRLAYKVAVIQQKTPFFTLADSFEQLKIIAEKDSMNRDKFMDEYSADIYPLVSVLIPTYKRPKYLIEALQSALKQTYRNLRIFISDNSPDEDTAVMIRELFSDDERIMYEHHPEFNADENWCNAETHLHPQAEYVNWLMDDDVWEENKIAVMMDGFFAHDDVVLVTSYRKLIDKSGVILEDCSWNKPMNDKDIKCDGEYVGNMILTNMWNFIGEPTTALIRRAALNHDRLGWTHTEGIYSYSDFPTWLQLMTKGNLLYMVTPLSYFRIHEGQDTYNADKAMKSKICWAVQMKEAMKRNVFLHTEIDKRKAILTWLSDVAYELKKMKNINWHGRTVKNLIHCYTIMAESLGNDCQLDFCIEGDTVIKCDR